jgi:hypothetical protein
MPNVVTEATGAALTDSSSDSIGVYLEPAATNLCIRSEEIDNATWLKSQVTITANAIAAPNGAVTFDKICEDNSNNTHQIQSGSFSVTSGTVYTASCYAKSSERTKFRMFAFDGSVNSYMYADFDVTNGTIITAATGGGTTPWTSGTARIELVSTGVYRCSVTGTCNATNAGGGILLRLSDGASFLTYLGVTGSGLHAWGFQFEANSAPTSYIPTTTASVTRPTDLDTLPTAVINDTQGWVEMEVQTPYQAASNGQRLFGSTNYTLSNAASVIQAYDGTNNPQATLAISTKKSICNTWGAGTQRVAGTGATAVSASYDGGWNYSGSVAVGVHANGTSVPVIIPYLEIGTRRLSDRQQNLKVGN